MYRILINMPSQFSGRPSGVAWVAFRLLSELIKNLEFDYILRSPWPKHELPFGLEKSRLSVIQISRPKYLLPDTFIQCLTMPGLCRRYGVDLILNVDSYGSPIGAKARVMIIHDLYFKTLSQFITKRQRLTSSLLWHIMAAGNEVIVSVSESTREVIVNAYPTIGSRVRTIYSAAILDEEYSQTSGPSTLKDYILIVGNNTFNKNFSFLIDGYKRLLAYHPQIKIVHVGSDSKNELEKLLGPALSAEYLIRFEKIESSLLIELYKNALCLCVTSHAEGFCLPILEAQKYGCAVLAANASAMPEVAGLGASLFQSGSLDDFICKLNRIVSDPAYRNKIRSSGFRNQQNYNWSKSATEYENIFRNLLK